MTLGEARQKIIQDLRNNYETGEAGNVAELLLEHILQAPKSRLIINYNENFPEEKISQLNEFINRLINDEPVQYILGEAWFAGRKFLVNRSVLVPRPETEELVDWIFQDQKNKPAVSIIDIGTGSGIIPVTLKNKLPAAEVSAIDVCSEALYTATENAVSAGTEIGFSLIDFLDESAWQQLGRFDVIVSNPPYVKQSEKKTMTKRVLEFEPHKALFVPDEDALLFYRKLADFSKDHLNTGGSLYVEINQTLGKEVTALFKKYPFSSVILKKDMQGKDRMIRAVK